MRAPVLTTRTIVVLTAAILTGPLASMPHAQSIAVTRIDTHPDVQAAQRLFTAWIEGQIVERGLPGLAVGFVSDQELVWAKGFGVADMSAKTPMTPQTRFRMASHSKLFSATAIMQLREEGKLRLDDPVTEHLPWFAVRQAEADDPPITIDELLTHSSGLPREAGSHWTTFNFPTSEELRGLMAGRQAPYPPETRWKYSNLAYAVAGLVIVQVSGLKWAEYLPRHVFAPLAGGGTTSSRSEASQCVAGRRVEAVMRSA